MSRLSRWAVRHPLLGLLAWLGLVAVVAVLGTQFEGKYNDSFELPDTESLRAQELLEDLPGGGASFDVATGQVVWKAASGDAQDRQTVDAITGLANSIAEVETVACVVTPYGEPVGSQCPEAEPPADGEAPPPTPDTPEAQRALAGFGAAGLSPDTPIGYATITFKGAFDDVPNEDALDVLNQIKALDGQDGLTVGASGDIFAFVGQEPPSSEGIGVMVALVILLFAFGAILGAVLPVVSAIVSVSITTALLLPFVARFLDVATFAPVLASMIGLGVGIDYSLFVINRYREALLRGRPTKEAALEAVNTSGRAVQFAAITVVIALLGLFLMRINFFNGLAVASASMVVMVATGALFLLPAVLSLLGPRAFAGRMAWIGEDEAVNRTRTSGWRHQVARVFRWVGWVLVWPVTLVGLLWRRVVGKGHDSHDHHGSAMARYANRLQRRPWLPAIVSLVVLGLLAIPTFAMRMGFPDNSGAPPGSPARTAYDLIAEGFGPGVNGPFFVAQEFESPGESNQEAFQQLVDALNADDGVAVAAGMPPAADSTAVAIQVVPTTAPQDEATSQLLERLRDDVIPAALAGTGSAAYVGGTQAIIADFTTMLAEALPLVLAVVVGLGFLALVVLFRSVLVPLMGALTSLLSLGVALGVTVAVFQWGWLADAIDVQSTGPILPFLPVMVFAILFGLSMDYQVFLVSRMQEEWSFTHDNRAAIRRGLAGSGRVVMIAAAIMTSVFGAFILGNDATIKVFGLSLSTAVLVDAFVVRMVLVPSLMTIVGPRNWWLPGWLDRLLPHVSHDVEADVSAGDASIDDIPEDELAPSRR